MRDTFIRVSTVKVFVLFVFETPSATFALPTSRNHGAQFASTHGSGASAFKLANEVKIDSVRAELANMLKSALTFGELTETSLWNYFFGISVLQVTLDVQQPPGSQRDIELWDSFTDNVQPQVCELLSSVLDTAMRSMWTTVLFTTSHGDQSASVFRAALPEITKVAAIHNSGFVNEGLCGIGMSWVETEPTTSLTERGESSETVVIATERDAVAFCASMYCIYDDVLADYGRWLSKRKPRGKSRAAQQFRYVESVRVHRNLHLGPNERGLNDGLWAVWGMPEMLSSLESLTNRLDHDLQNATQNAAGLAQIAFAIGAAVIAVLVGVEPIRKLLGISDSTTSSAAILGALVAIELVAFAAIFLVSRRRHRH